MTGVFQRHAKEWKEDARYLTERKVLEINEQICELMAEKNVSRAELARRLGTSRAWVTGVLNGTPNLTVETLIKVAVALQAKIEVKIEANDQAKSSV